GLKTASQINGGKMRKTRTRSYERRTELLCLRVLPATKVLVGHMAREQGRNMSDVIEDAVLAAAARRARKEEPTDAPQPEVNPYPLYRPQYVELGPQTLAALRNMVFMALPDWPRPIALPPDNKPSEQIKLDGGLKAS